MNPDDLIESIKDLLLISDVNLMQLSRDTEVSYTVLREIKSGARTNCTVSTLSAIYKKLTEINPQKSCLTCRHYDSTDEGAHICLLHGCGAIEEPPACYMHQPVPVTLK
jgi:hypothetical protein